MTRLALLISPLPLALLVLQAAGSARASPLLVELQRTIPPDQALVLVEAALRDRPEEVRPLGLDYLRGHLLERLGRPRDAAGAFADAMAADPALEPFSRYRLARIEARLHHPEVAAGLLASLLATRPPEVLEGPASRLFQRSVEQGGDCRLLRGLTAHRLPVEARRRLELAAADCARRSGDLPGARRRLLEVVEERAEDEPAREAAERLRALASKPLAPDLALELGRAFHHHRSFELAAPYLRSLAHNLPERLGDDRGYEVLYLLARSHYWQEDYPGAAKAFSELARRSRSADGRAQALFQEARCRELLGSWREATTRYLESVQAAPGSDWAGPALLAALRLEWRAGREANALVLYDRLRERWEWRRESARAGLFLAASEVVRGRTDRVAGWLAEAARATPRSEAEVDYWRGRLAEARGRPGAAIEAYLELLQRGSHHPLAVEARRRLGGPELAPVFEEEVARRSRSPRFVDRLAGWLLLPTDDPRRHGLEQRLYQHYLRNPDIAPYLHLAPVDPADWPLWSESHDGGEEQLVALGRWDEVEVRTVLRYFPVREPALAHTASLQLQAAGAYRRSLYLAEILVSRIEDRLPEELLPVALRRTLYPFPYLDLVRLEARRQHIDPFLLVAVMRQESRFDPEATSPAAARGLTQFILPTARRIGSRIGLSDLTAEQLYRPAVAIALGAAYLRELGERFQDNPLPVAAAYNAGEAQVRLWQAWCFSRDPAELFTKIGFAQTRHYVTEVLENRRHYRELYGTLLSAAPPEDEEPGG